MLMALGEEILCAAAFMLREMMLERKDNECEAH